MDYTVGVVRVADDIEQRFRHEHFLLPHSTLVVSFADTVFAVGTNDATQQ
jgi:hypothetical protein